MSFLTGTIGRVFRLSLFTVIVLFACTDFSHGESGKSMEKPETVVAVIHCDYRPVSFWDESVNMPSGFFVDIMDRIAPRAGLKVNYICRKSWPEIINAIEQGEADLGVLLKSGEREKKLLFSDPIDVSYLSFFARSPSSVSDDTAPFGYTVGVIKGSMSHEHLESRPGLKLHMVGSYQEGILSLLAGEIDLFAGEQSTVWRQAREAGLDDRIRKVGVPFVERERCIAVKKDNARLLGLLNNTLRGFTGGPEYNQIHIKWYGRPTPYWTAKRILFASGFFLFLIICGMTAWRYASIRRINKELLRSIAERRAAEEMLQKTNETLSALIHYSPLAIICTDIETNVLIWNPAAELIFGWNEKEVLGRKNPIVPEDKQTEYMRLREQVRHGKPYHTMELCRQKKDGTLIYLNASSSALYDANGNVIGLLGIFEDITEHKQAEAILQASEKQLAESQRIAHIGSWEHNVTTGHAVWSDEMFRVLGLDPKKEEADFRMFLDMVHPDDRKSLEKTVEETVRSGNPFSIEYRFVRRDGTVRTIYARAELIHDDVRAQSILSGTAQDITERKLAEEKMRQSEQFIRNILDTVDEGFIVVDRDFRILTANKAYCNQVSLPCEKVIGRRCFEISHKLDRPCYEAGEECAVHQVFETGEPQAALHRHPRDGHILYVETKAYPVRDGAGRVTSVIETINNITEKHLLEEERLKTQKLESIGTLAGGIAHDFNNLLQGIFGYISMARMTIGQPERSLAMLSQAEKALQQSVNLTTQLLTFSKGGKPMKKIVPLLPVIDNAVKFALSGSRAMYHIQCEPDLWQAEADDGQIGQVIQNIVLNADQAMPEGGQIKVAARNIEMHSKDLPQGLNDGKYVEIVIEDSGIGIPRQYLSKIFDPYFSTKEKGSGLGLATSYSIVRNHGGAIDVQSEIGKGSVFSLYLPAVEARVEEPPPPASPVRARKGRILVMDDEDLVREIVGEMIIILGHEVEPAENGAVAVEKYRAARETDASFDIVILDLTVRGGMGGAEALQELLAFDPEVKAVVSSGYCDDAAAIAGFHKQGFKAFLKKPYDVGELRNVLHGLLNP